MNRMNEPKKTVIIPVYNAEKTICRCLDSLLLQPHSNTEILLIDDGSTDSSESICRSYVGTHRDVYYFKKANGGVSSARNFGLDHASGDYVLFVDSDDYVADNYLATIDSVLSDYDYDLVQLSNYIENKETIITRSRKDFHATNRGELLPYLMKMLHQKRSNQPWAKVYKRSIIQENGIRFPEEIEIGEDRAFLIYYSFYISSFCVSSIPVYFVNIENDGSLSRKRRQDFDVQIQKQREFLNCILSNNNSETEREEYLKAFHFDELRMIYTRAKNYHKDKIALSERLKKLHGICEKFKEQQRSFPDSVYCKVLVFPIQHNLTFLIDAVGWKMAH